MDAKAVSRENRITFSETANWLTAPSRTFKNEKGRAEPDLPLPFWVRQYIRGHITE
ncbi:hypothetical protein [Brucella pituitosa]|uniref:hypothetical protein n=1 Tax=Brucella pituitosa TaxID=571256 RepID=UPI0014795064|nr:hypothetical protein [Brucella pituitosa]